MALAMQTKKPSVPGNPDSAILEAPTQQVFDLNGSATAVRIESLKRGEVNSELMREIGSLYHDGFGGKRCCLCCSDSESSLQADARAAYSKFPDSKLEACAVARDADGHALGLAQLGSHDTSGDWQLPACMHSKLQSDTSHLERIVVGANARGKGLGKKLLDWADIKSRERGCKQIKLEVVRGNPAKRLYEKHGYVTVTGNCARCTMCPLIFCLVGHIYIDTMTKTVPSD